MTELRGIVIPSVNSLLLLNVLLPNYLMISWVYFTYRKKITPIHSVVTRMISIDFFEKIWHEENIRTDHEISWIPRAYIYCTLRDGISLTDGHKDDKRCETFLQTTHLHSICSVQFGIHTANLFPSTHALQTVYIHAAIDITTTVDGVCSYQFPVDQTFNTPSDFSVYFETYTPHSICIRVFGSST